MAIVHDDHDLDDALMGLMYRDLKQSHHLATAMDAIMAAGRESVTAYAPPLKPGQHMHVCACSDYYVHSGDPDQCQVTEPWTCTACALEQQEQHLNRLAELELNR